MRRIRPLLGAAGLSGALLLIVLLLPAGRAQAQGYFSTAGYSLAGARGTLLRDVDGVAVNPALIGMPGRKAFSLRLFDVSTHFDQNIMNVARWNRWQGTLLTDLEKQDILDAVGEAVRFNSVSEVQLLALQVGRFAFGTNVFVSSEGRIPSALLDIALNGTELDRTYHLGEVGVRSEAVTVLNASWAFRMGLLERLARNILLPIEHINAGISVKTYLGHVYAGDSDGQADLFLGRYGMTGLADYTYRTAGIPGGLVDEESDDASIVADSTFATTAGRGYGIDLGIGIELDNGFSMHGALLNISPGIKWTGSTYLAHVTASVDTLSIGDFLDVDSQGAADIDSLTSHDITVERTGAFRTPVPLILRLGATYRYGRLALNGEFEQAFTRAWGYNLVPRVGLGIEFRPLGLLPLRAGVSLGGRAGLAGAVGFGLDFKAVVFDLAVGNTGLTPGGVRGLGVSTGLKVSW